MQKDPEYALCVKASISYASRNYADLEKDSMDLGTCHTAYCLDDENGKLITSTVHSAQAFSTEKQLKEMYSKDNQAFNNLQRKITQVQNEMTNGILELSEKTHYDIKEKLIKNNVHDDRTE